MERGRGGRGGHQGGGAPRASGREVGISKTLSWILRHGAVELGLSIRPDGYVPVSEILQVPNILSMNHLLISLELKVTVDEIRSVVDNNDKKRYQLISEVDAFGFEGLWIRAVQGHTIAAVHDEELLRPILDPFQFEEVVHGTYLKVAEPIMKDGLCKMARNHIRKGRILNEYRYGYRDAREEGSN